MRAYLLHFLLILLTISATGGTWYLMKNQQDQIRINLEAQVQTEKDIAAKNTAAWAEEKASLENQIAELTDTTDSLSKDKSELQDSLEEEKDKVDTIQKQVGGAIKTVGVLDKLSKTDKELLQKYSKVAFLNEHYIPSKLSPIDKTYLYNESAVKKLHSQVMPFFEDMVKDALDDDVKLYVSSAYRSFGEQGALKNTYTVTYGTGANTFSADQGYSEHQLGTAIDFTTTGINGGLDGFDTTPAYTWMLKNAYKYGFTLSYPKGNAYYIFEPWHWRFVGVDLATQLHKDNKYFYDMDQREIDKYLISIFD